MDAGIPLTQTPVSTTFSRARCEHDIARTQGLLGRKVHITVVRRNNVPSPIYIFIHDGQDGCVLFVAASLHRSSPCAVVSCCGFMLAHPGVRAAGGRCALRFGDEAVPDAAKAGCNPGSSAGEEGGRRESGAEGPRLCHCLVVPRQGE